MDTQKTLLHSDSQLTRSINEVIKDTLSARGSQEQVLENLKYNPVRMMPENSTLMTMRYPAPVTPMTLQLNSYLIEKHLQEIRHDAINHSWPDNLAGTVALASSEMLAVIWDTPEEDEAWRDL